MAQIKHLENRHNRSLMWNSGVFPNRQKGEKMAVFKSSINECQERIEQLADEARGIVNEHWRFHYRNNALLAPREKARLNVWVRLRGSVLEIYWTHFRFAKEDGAPKANVISSYIPKGKGNKYRARSLAIRAKDWELEETLEFEERMSRIRSEYADISKAASLLRRAQKKAAERVATV